MPTTADVVVRALKQAGIAHVFGYPGGQNMRFIEAMGAGGVEFVLVTHEASAGFMADVSARLTGRPGACTSTLGPGATNMTTGVGNAFLDRVPVLAFTGKMGRKWRGRTVQMQVDHQAIFAPLTKWTTELEAVTADDTVRRAIRVAESEQPGPVHLDFPEDVAEDESEWHEGSGKHEGSGTREGSERHEGSERPEGSEHHERSLGAAEVAVRDARHPLVAVGLTMNRAGATAALRAFVQRHNLPVVCTMMAKGHVPESGGHFVGVLGRARRDIVAEFCAPADLDPGRRLRPGRVQLRGLGPQGRPHRPHRYGAGGSGGNAHARVRCRREYSACARAPHCNGAARALVGHGGAAGASAPPR